MKHISTTIAATLALATTAIALEMTRNKTAPPAIETLAAPAPNAGKAEAAIPPPDAANSNAQDFRRQQDSSLQHDSELRAAKPADATPEDTKALDAKPKEAIEAKASAPDLDLTIADPKSSADVLNAETSGARAPAAAAENPKVEAAAPEPGKPAAKQRVAAHSSSVTAEAKPTGLERPQQALAPQPLEKPRHAHHPRVDHAARWRRDRENERTDAGVYGFSASFGGCQYRGALTAYGYRIEGSC